MNPSDKFSACDDCRMPAGWRVTKRANGWRLALLLRKDSSQKTLHSVCSKASLVGEKPNWELKKFVFAAWMKPVCGDNLCCGAGQRRKLKCSEQIWELLRMMLVWSTLFWKQDFTLLWFLTNFLEILLSTLRPLKIGKQRKKKFVNHVYSECRTGFVDLRLNISE